MEDFVLSILWGLFALSIIVVWKKLNGGDEE